MTKTKPTHPLHFGSGTVIVATIIVTLGTLLFSGSWIGWDLTWRSFGVTPLHPYFFDMHALTDHVACAKQGFNPYELNTCDPLLPFNYPPIWLWLSHLGIDGTDSAWISILMTVATLAVLVKLLKGRSIGDGVFASLAILSPSMMMGVERGNIDLLILAMVGGAALLVAEYRPVRMACAAALVSVAVVLKLYPVFCTALAARLNRGTLFFAVAVAAVSLVYFTAISGYLPVIRTNTPTTFLLSYGYKVPFLGVDQLAAEAHLGPAGLANTWLPITLTILTLILAAATAACLFRQGSFYCAVTNGVAGTAFLFGAGIYCGTYMLGSNFTYRLMFLLLCLPQILDWRGATLRNSDLTAGIAHALLIAVLAVLWLNGNATFMFVPQLIDWILIFGLTTILLLNLLRGAGHGWAVLPFAKRNKA
jgi:hypothetical protein